jgi:hypothetical protein
MVLTKLIKTQILELLIYYLIRHSKIPQSTSTTIYMDGVLGGKL